MLTDVDTALSTPEGMTSHSEWVSTEMTKKMLGEVRKFIRPTSVRPEPNSTLGEQALLNYGIQVGMEAALDFLLRAPVYAAALKAQVEQVEIEADFGAQEILQSLGYRIKKERGDK